MQQSLIENTRDFTHGVEPFVDAVRDINFKPDMAGNSWFWAGHFESEGHVLNFLYHVSVLQISKYLPVKMINSVLSITDETQKIYRHEDRFYKIKNEAVAKESLQIHTDQDTVEGDLDTMHIASRMKHGTIDITMHGKGYPLYCLCTGYFQIAGAPNYQYSFPTMEAAGRLTLEDITYPMRGMVWFDRQFAYRPKGRKLGNGYNCKWVWMDIHFDNNADKISLFGVTELMSGKENCWATVLHPDGTQSGAGVDPMVSNSFDIWESKTTGMRYPTGWVVIIPEWNCWLTVKSVMDEQEIAADNPAGRKYEGASYITGIYKGKETTGYCCLELVGGWNEAAAERRTKWKIRQMRCRRWTCCPFQKQSIRMYFRPLPPC